MQHNYCRNEVLIIRLSPAVTEVVLSSGTQATLIMFSYVHLPKISMSKTFVGILVARNGTISSLNFQKIDQEGLTDSLVISLALSRDTQLYAIEARMIRRVGLNRAGLRLHGAFHGPSER